MLGQNGATETGCAATATITIMHLVRFATGIILSLFCSTSLVKLSSVALFNKYGSFWIKLMWWCIPNSHFCCVYYCLNWCAWLWLKNSWMLLGVVEQQSFTNSTFNYGIENVDWMYILVPCNPLASCVAFQSCTWSMLVTFEVHSDVY